MNGIEKVTRRDFLRHTGLGAGALVLGCHVAGTGSLFAQEIARFAPNHFVAIEADGTVVIIAHRSEMGQGIRSTLPAVVADELEADWGRVQVQQADADKKYGDQWTDGSRSVTMFYQKMRQAPPGRWATIRYRSKFPTRYRRRSSGRRSIHPPTRCRQHPRRR